MSADTDAFTRMGMTMVAYRNAATPTLSAVVTEGGVENTAQPVPALTVSALSVALVLGAGGGERFVPGVGPVGVLAVPTISSGWTEVSSAGDFGLAERAYLAGATLSGDWTFGAPPSGYSALSGLFYSVEIPAVRTVVWQDAESSRVITAFAPLDVVVTNETPFAYPIVPCRRY